MIYSVKIYTDKGHVGTISLKSDSKTFVLEPPDSKRLHRILSEPIWILGKSTVDDVHSNTEPVRFIQGLYMHYKSYMMRASRATIESGSSEPNSPKPAQAESDTNIPLADTPPSRAPPRRTTDETVPPPPPPPVAPPPPPPPPAPAPLPPPPVPQNPPVPHQSGGPGTQRRYGLRPGPGWRAGGQSRRGTPIWLWGPHTRPPTPEEEEREELAQMQPAEPPPQEIPLPPQEGVSDAAIRGAGQPTTAPVIQNSGRVEGTPQGTGAPGTNQVRQGANTPTGNEATGTGTAEARGSRQSEWGNLEPFHEESGESGEPLSPEDTVELEEVNQFINQYWDILYSHGHWQVANWVSELQEFINEVGPDEALEYLGEERQGSMERVAYESTGHLGEDEESQLIKRYLDRVGIMLITDDASPPEDIKVVRSAPPPEEREGKYKKEDTVPAWTNIEDKLQEAKILPGLETTEDLDVINGAPVTNFTDDVIAKLDEKYGKDKWIVKTYGDEAYAGFGIFLPPYVHKTRQTADTILQNANRLLMEKGFTLARDKDTKKVLGIMSTDGKTGYRFGSERLRALPNPEIRNLTNAASRAALHEHGTSLPLSSDDDLYYKTGVKIKWSDQVKQDGTRDALGFETLSGREVKFGTPEWEAMKNDENYEYMVDKIYRTAEMGGVRSNVRYMAQPAFPALGVTDEDRAKGLTWETGHEGRVHIVTRNGKVTVVPYATMANRGDTIPVVFASEDILAMEKAAQEAIEAGPESERNGQVYAPDVMKTADGWRVVERNASVPTGSSAWLEANPLVIDAYVSHLAGRDPAHVQFIRGLLKGKPKARPKGLPVASTKEH